MGDFYWPAQGVLLPPLIRHSFRVFFNLIMFIIIIIITIIVVVLYQCTVRCKDSFDILIN